MVGVLEVDNDGYGRASRALTERTLALYSIDDYDALRSTMVPDCVGFDHRPIGLGTACR
jgi:hypothetical protein